MDSSVLQNAFPCTAREQGVDYRPRACGVKDFLAGNALTRAVLYELVSGRRAFGGETAIQVLSSVLRDETRALEVSGELPRIVRRCLRKTPEQRYGSMREVRAALQGGGCSSLSAAQTSIAVLPFANLSRDEAERVGFGLFQPLWNL